MLSLVFGAEYYCLGIIVSSRKSTNLSKGEEKYARNRVFNVVNIRKLKIPIWVERTFGRL